MVRAEVVTVRQYGSLNKGERMAASQIQQLHSKLAKLEGKTKQSSIGNVRELIALLSDFCYENAEAFPLLYENGKKRAKRKKK